VKSLCSGVHLTSLVFDVYCTVHDEHVINTKCPTYMHNFVLFRRGSLPEDGRNASEKNEIVHVNWKFCINYSLVFFVYVVMTDCHIFRFSLH
jgi:hypothetical protein